MKTYRILTVILRGRVEVFRFDMDNPVDTVLFGASLVSLNRVLDGDIDSSPCAIVSDRLRTGVYHLSGLNGYNLEDYSDDEAVDCEPEEKQS